jgi:hypothetical protein
MISSLMQVSKAKKRQNLFKSCFFRLENRLYAAIYV